MEYLVVFIFGAVIGSFLNVCIYRIPLGKSLVSPRSFCPSCGKTIKWYHNVPLVSFVILGARCAGCKAPIPLRYFLVELITAFSAVLLFYFFWLSAQFFIYWLFVCALITVSFIDIEKGEIPDVISVSGVIAGVIFVTIFRLDNSNTYLEAFLDSVFGILAGGMSMFLLGFLGGIVFKKEALGGGDVKLMAMIGAFVGWKLVLLTFFLAPVFGACVGIFMKIRFKRETIPYGPYIALAAIVSLLYGNRILGFLFSV